MAHPKVSLKRAKNLSFACFLLGFAIVFYTNTFWPGMTLVIGIPLALRQYLLGRMYDAILSLATFSGVFFASGYDLPWDILLPVLFTLAALYLVIREFLNPYPLSEPEEEESLSHEITDEEK